MATKVEEIMATVADLTRQCKELEDHNEQLEIELARKQTFAEEIGQTMDEDREAHLRMVKEAKRKLKRVKHKIAERERFVEAQRDSVQGKVVLDVGGTRFTTTLSTLGDSVLAALFYGRQDLETGEGGAVFIDRDPQAFATILKWLRTGITPRIPEEAERRTLMLEAAHYGLDQLVQELEREREAGADDEVEQAHKGKEKPVGWIKITTKQYLDLINRPPHPQGLKLNGCDLRGFDFYGMDLRCANFHRCNLEGVDLRRAKLAEACFVECRLRGANLSGATLSGADLSHADCRRADLTDADLKGASLIGADLAEAKLVGAVLEENAHTEGAADMGAGRVNGVALKEANRASANLAQVAHLENRVPDVAYLTGADPTKAGAGSSRPTNVRLAKSDLACMGLAKRPDGVAVDDLRGRDAKWVRGAEYH